MFHIRSVNISDLDIVYEFTLRLLRHHFGTEAQSQLDQNGLKKLFENGFLHGLLLLCSNEEYSNNLLGDNGLNNLIPIGFMIYHYDISLLHGGFGIALDQFYIEPEYRRLGFGRKMMNRLCYESQSLNANYIKLSYQDGIGLERVYGNLGYINHTRGPPGLHIFELYGKQNVLDFLKNNQYLINNTYYYDNDKNLNEKSVNLLPSLLILPIGELSDQNKIFYPSWYLLNNVPEIKTCKNSQTYPFPKAQLVIVMNCKNNYVNETKQPPPQPQQQQQQKCPVNELHLGMNNQICMFVEQCCVCSWLGPMINFSDFIGDLNIISKELIYERIQTWYKAVPELCGAVWEVPCGPNGIRPQIYFGQIVNDPNMNYLNHISLVNNLISLGVQDDTTREGWNINYLDKEQIQFLSKQNNKN